MIRERIVYEVYEDDTMVDRGTSAEIADRFYTSAEQVTKMARTGGRLQWHYRIKAAGKEVDKEYAAQDERIKADYMGGMDLTTIGKRMNLSSEGVRRRINEMRKRGEIA